MTEQQLPARTRSPWPGRLVAMAVGVGVGAWIGATIQGSGMLYTNLFLGACLLVLIAATGASALVAAKTSHAGTAGNLASFAAAIVVATPLALAVAPGYQAPVVATDRPASVVVRLDEPTANAWTVTGKCSVAIDKAWVSVWADIGQLLPGTWASISLGLRPGPAPALTGLTILTRPGTDVYEAAKPDLEATTVAADGLEGTVRFTAARVARGAAASRDPSARFSGTLDWSCRESEEKPSTSVGESVSDGEL